MARWKLNLVLLMATAACLVASWRVVRDDTRPNYELTPEAQMARSPAYSSFDPNPNFSDGKTLRSPPTGTLRRGELAIHYSSGAREAERAGKELPNPLPAASTQVRKRGAFLFATYCQVCHGPDGLGDGPVTRRGVPAPLSLLTGKSVQMKDGALFHVLTYGQGNMASHASQLSPSDRWCVIHHIRRLQNKLAVPADVRLADTARVYQTSCAACHGADGSGALLRARFPRIPDFTSRAWQVSQTDLEIINRIEYGDLPDMPTFRYLLSRDQILALAAYIRTFAGTKPAQPGAPAVPGGAIASLSPVQIFRANCLACHNVDGRGDIVRTAMPDIPDFTSAKWQDSRKDDALAEAILKGGKYMPPMKERGLSPADAARLVRFVRAFQGGKQVVALESLDVPKAPVPVPRGIRITPKSPSGPPPLPRPDTALSEDMGRRVRAGAVIFREYCIICHGPDGAGSGMRGQLPSLPDFRSAAFQTDHSDPQLLISILDGKGSLMPANRGRVTEAQASDLVAYVRSFGPPVLSSPQGPSDFRQRFDALQDQLDALERQLKALSQTPAKP